MSDRDCENCTNHTDNGCTKWECEYSPLKMDLWELMMETRICNSVTYCEDCPRYADDCDGDPDMMKGEEDE